jgi:serine/threonine protein kinase
MPPEVPIEDTQSSTSSLPDEVLIEEGHYYIIDDHTRLPFTHEKPLGSGHSAIVEKVQDKRTGAVFAVKTLKYGSARARAQKKDSFDNEVNITRSLKGHHHIIRLFATYEAKREFALIQQPAADEGNLEQYIDNYSEAIEKCSSSFLDNLNRAEAVLQRAFGCLASGLTYIHSKKIRHRDIKPRNIVMHQGSVIYIDFGSSKDASQQGENTTEGLVDFQTKIYSPPEVLNEEYRNMSADVYSLGCVFIEIFAALSRAVKYEHNQCYAHIMKQLHSSIASANVSPNMSFLKEIITSMTQELKEDRQTAGCIYSDISKHVLFLCHECGQEPKLKGKQTAWKWCVEQSRYYCYIRNEYGKELHHIWDKLQHHDLPDIALPPTNSSRSVTLPFRFRNLR